MPPRSSSPNLPVLASNPRASLASWIRCQDVIEKAFLSYPNPFLFDSKPLTTGSFITIARDAIRGAIAFDYPSFTDKTSLQEWSSKIIFTKYLDKVYIGLPKGQELVPFLSLNSSETSSPSSSPFQFTSLSLEETYAFILLLSHGRIQGPVEILSPPSPIDFSPFTNIEHVYKPNGTLVLI